MIDLADHPRLYWNLDCTPDTDWFRLLRSVPNDRVWTSKGDGHGHTVWTLDVLVPADKVWTSKSDSVTINRQRARTPHFLGLLWFVFFIGVHVTFVFITSARANLNQMFAGVHDSSWDGVWIFVLAAAVLIASWLLASPLTIRFARVVQNVGKVMVGGLKGLAEKCNPTIQYTEKDILPHFWANGTLPATEEFKTLEKDGFVNYSSRVDGLVKNPREFSYAELRDMPKQEQITEHFCIQGWSGVAKWGGVPMRHILDIVKPAPQAWYVVFYSFAEGQEKGIYYNVHNLRNIRHKLTTLAYEMIGSPLPLLHGAPLWLQCENELGFKQVKWLRAIEFVHDYKHLGAGQGGYNEDHEFYGNRMSI